ncbi:MAG: FIST signal transduction protein [Thermonemataceae bacterium]
MKFFRTLSHFQKDLADITMQEDEYLLMFIGEDTKDMIEAIIDTCNQYQVRVVGAIFPKIISFEGVHTAGIITEKIKTTQAPTIIQNIEQSSPLPALHSTTKTSLVLVDGLSSHITPFLSNLYNTWGDSTYYIGGGAGSISLQQQPCIFSNEGVFQEAALVCFLPQEIRPSVQHGWKSFIDMPLVASKTVDNTIQELNWGSAFHMYKELIGTDIVQEMTTENFFEIARCYPFGIVRENDELIVRDPIATNEEGELVCVGDIPENTILRVLKGTTTDLLTAAKKVKRESLGTLTASLKSYFVFDSISRAMCLQEDFQQELDIIREGITQSCFLGALTLGEIAAYKDGQVEFFNKTIVTGALYE